MPRRRPAAPALYYTDPACGPLDDTEPPVASQFHRNPDNRSEVRGFAPHSPLVCFRPVQAVSQQAE